MMVLALWCGILMSARVVNRGIRDPLHVEYIVPFAARQTFGDKFSPHGLCAAH